MTRFVERAITIPKAKGIRNTTGPGNWSILTRLILKKKLRKPNESLKAEEALLNFFDAIGAYDYQRMRDITSENYVFIENGPIRTVDSLITFMKQFEGQATISYEFSDM